PGIVRAQVVTLWLFPVGGGAGQRGRPARGSCRRGRAPASGSVARSPDSQRSRAAGGTRGSHSAARRGAPPAPPVHRPTALTGRFPLRLLKDLSPTRARAGFACFCRGRPSLGRRLRARWVWAPGRLDGGGNRDRMAGLWGG